MSMNSSGIVVAHQVERAAKNGFTAASSSIVTPQSHPGPAVKKVESQADSARVAFRRANPRLLSFADGE